MKKLFVIYIFFLVLAPAAYSQSSIGLDSLFLTTRNLMQKNELTPPLPGDSSSKSIQVELDVAFFISDTTQLDYVEVRYGTTAGASDIFDMTLSYQLVNQKPFLIVNGTQFPVYGNYRVYITQLIPQFTLQDAPDYVWIRAKDKQGRYTNILTDVN